MILVDMIADLRANLAVYRLHRHAAVADELTRLSEHNCPEAKAQFIVIILIAGDPAFGMTKQEIMALLEPVRYIGRCPEQVEEFLAEQVAAVLARYVDAGKPPAPELSV